MQKKSSKGFITILLIGIIVLGGFLFVGGRNIFRDIKKPVSPEQTYRIDNSSLAMNPEKSLQLDNFGFIALPTNTPTPTGAITPTPTLPPGVPTPTPTIPVGNSPSPRVPTSTPTIPVFPPPTGQARPSPTPYPTVPFIYPSPGVPICEINSRKEPSCQCDPITHDVIKCDDGRKCYDFGYCEDLIDEPGCAEYCIFAKPVIYLYPLEITTVNVTLSIPGEIIISDPLYPEGGWKNVHAYPDGTLYYNGEKYRELFYETNVNNYSVPNKGIIISKSKIQNTLKEITYLLGLVSDEQKEFLDFWIPRLQALNSPYIFFSVIDSIEKERIDGIKITPKPDTRIEFLAYFRPENKIFYIEPLHLPQRPPARKGFTMVEWGGTIDQRVNRSEVNIF